MVVVSCCIIIYPICISIYKSLHIVQLFSPYLYFLKVFVRLELCTRMVLKEAISLLFVLIVAVSAEHYLFTSQANNVTYKFPLSSRFISHLSSCGDVELLIFEHIITTLGDRFDSYVDLSPEEGFLTSVIAQYITGIAYIMPQTDSETLDYFLFNMQEIPGVFQKIILGPVDSLKQDALQSTFTSYVRTYLELQTFMPSGNKCPDAVFFHYLSSDHMSDFWIFLQNYAQFIDQCHSIIFFDSLSINHLFAVENILASHGYKVSYQPLCTFCTDNTDVQYRFLLTGIYTGNGEEFLRTLKAHEQSNPFFFAQTYHQYLSLSQQSVLNHVLSTDLSEVKPSECTWKTGLINSSVTLTVPFQTIFPFNSLIKSCLLPYLYAQNESLRALEIQYLDLEVHWDVNAKLNDGNSVFTYLNCIAYMNMLRRTFESMANSHWIPNTFSDDSFCPSYSDKTLFFDAVYGELGMATVSLCADHMVYQQIHQRQYFQQKFQGSIENRKTLIQKAITLSNDTSSSEYIRLSQVSTDELYINGAFLDYQYSLSVDQPMAHYLDEKSLPIHQSWFHTITQEKEHANVLPLNSMKAHWHDYARLFYKKLQKWQNPALIAKSDDSAITNNSRSRSCATAKFLIYEPLSEHQGIGAILDQILAAMQYALCLERILVYTARDVEGTLGKYAIPGCADRNPFHCFFEPLTSCLLTEQDIASSPAFSTTGEGFEARPLSDERILVLRGLPQAGKCAKITLPDTFPEKNSASHDGKHDSDDIMSSSSFSIDNSAWINSWQTKHFYPKRYTASPNVHAAMYALQRQQQLALYLPYILRPTSWATKWMRDLVDYVVVSPTNSIRHPVVPEPAPYSLHAHLDLHQTSFASPKKDFPTNYILLHTRYPYYDLIDPHTLNDFEAKQWHKPKDPNAKLYTTADAFEVYEQPTYQELMAVVIDKFPHIKDVVLLSDSLSILGQLNNEYPEHRFHHLRLSKFLMFNTSSSTYDRNNNFETIGNSRDTQMKALSIWMRIFSELYFVPNAQGGVGMACSHWSSLLQKALSLQQQEKPFYLVGKDDTFQQADDGYWFPPRLVYGRQPISHGRDFIHYKHIKSIAESSDLYQHLSTLRAYAAKPEIRVLLECGVRDALSSWAFAQGLLDQNQRTEAPNSPRRNHQDENKGNRNAVTTHRYYAVDLVRSPYVVVLEHHVEIAGIDYAFHEGSDLEFPIPETVDLLFIDTLHVYGQLLRELRRFAPYTRHYILLHDTSVDGLYGEVVRMNYNVTFMSEVTGMPEIELINGLWPAVEGFLQSDIAGGRHWRVQKRYLNNNGLTILERVDQSSLIELHL